VSTGIDAVSIFRPDELPSKDRGSGARTVPFATTARGATTFLNGVTSFEPGAAIGHHTHNVAESVMVVLGSAIVDIDGERTELRTFDTTFVPANIPHHFENASAEDEMKIFWTYGSIDSTRTVIESGEHSRIDAEQAVPRSDPDGNATTGYGGLVHEVAQITAKPGRTEEFEAAVAAAAPLFQRTHGARTFVLERSHENPLSYRLVVGWETIEDHLEGFRGSAAFVEWRRLITDSVAEIADVSHFRNVLTAF
jgi:quercetin dioxygenase-like cupin family protein/heme-degrading monooxygenase HmoA